MSNRTYDRCVFRATFKIAADETVSVAGTGSVERTGRVVPMEVVQHHIAHYFDGAGQIEFMIRQQYGEDKRVGKWDRIIGEVVVEELFGVDGEITIKYR